MSQPRSVRRLFAAAFGALTLAASGLGLAGEIRIDGGECASAVHLVARDAPLSDVLKRLANALDFQLNFSSDSDPVINVDVVRSPIDLVARLAPLENLSLTQARNPLCPDRERIGKVWVLPNAPGSASRAAVAYDAMQRREESERARRAQVGIDMIRSAHGMSSAPDVQAKTQ